MVRRPLSFWIFYFDNIAGGRMVAVPAILISIRLNVAQPGAKPRVKAQTARRRAATIGDGLICSPTQTLRFTLPSWTPILSRRSFFGSLNHFPGKIELNSK